MRNAGWKGLGRLSVFRHLSVRWQTVAQPAWDTTRNRRTGTVPGVRSAAIRYSPHDFGYVPRRNGLARVVLLASPMCGYANSNWMFSLTSLVVFAGLIAASVIFLVRSFNQKPEKRDDEKS